METSIIKRPYYSIAAIVLFIVVAVASLTPGNELPKVQFHFADKIVHFLMYFILSVVWAKAFDFSHIKWKKIKLNSFVLVFFYGIFIEIAQEFCTNSRFFDIFDILANSMGILLAVMLRNKPFLK